mmetsp:Transcript_2918/g.4234  ORF Transcript_2918/g.4234 Transcript_2918/m.4234 type:complete len:202 (-) Transcript_2918:398-1003(-)
MMQSTWRMILQRRESISLKGKRSLFNFALFVDVHIIDSSIIVSTLYYRNSFKEELSNALDQALPDAGAIRLEARARYIGRVVDAIDAALSKHDHIFIPASTRLGRVRATVPTCVACDRPLTSKCRKLPDGEKIEKKEGMLWSLLKKRQKMEIVNDFIELIFFIYSGDTKNAPRPKSVTASYANKNEVKPFVMRGGFKMPSS